jgi:hypothetical protein
MSIMGTGVAAGVAQTALTAQQVARQRDKRARENARPGQRVRDIYETHLKVLEEHDEGEATPRLVVDDQMQDRHAEQPLDPVERRERKPGGDEAPPQGPRLDVKA